MRPSNATAGQGLKNRWDTPISPAI
jgi:hypothetical protein